LFPAYWFYVFWVLSLLRDLLLIKKETDTNEHPRIVNIINFIRLLEPRDQKITNDILYETVVEQIAMMKSIN